MDCVCVAAPHRRLHCRCLGAPAAHRRCCRCLSPRSSSATRAPRIPGTRARPRAPHPRAERASLPSLAAWSAVAAARAVPVTAAMASTQVALAQVPHDNPCAITSTRDHRVNKRPGGAGKDEASVRSVVEFDDSWPQLDGSWPNRQKRNTRLSKTWAHGDQISSTVAKHCTHIIRRTQCEWNGEQTVNETCKTNEQLAGS